MLQAQNSEFHFTYYYTRLGLVHRFNAYCRCKTESPICFQLRTKTALGWSFSIIFSLLLFCFSCSSNCNLILVSTLMLGPRMLKLFFEGMPSWLLYCIGNIVTSFTRHSIRKSGWSFSHLQATFFSKAFFAKLCAETLASLKQCENWTEPIMPARIKQSVYIAEASFQILSWPEHALMTSTKSDSIWIECRPISFASIRPCFITNVYDV